MKSILEKIYEATQQEHHRYVDVFIVADDNVLILQRANYMRKFGGCWGVVGGSIEKTDKDSRAAAICETLEETGIDIPYVVQTKMQHIDTMKHKDDSTSDFWVVQLDEMPEKIKLSREHRRYMWFNADKRDEIKKWMPDIFQAIQKILDD